MSCPVHSRRTCRLGTEKSRRRRWCGLRDESVSVAESCGDYDIHGGQYKRVRKDKGSLAFRILSLKLTILTVSRTIRALPSWICTTAPGNDFSDRRETEAIVQTDVHICAACTRLTICLSSTSGIAVGFRAVWEVTCWCAYRCHSPQEAS